MKKKAVVILSLVFMMSLIVSLSACGNEESNDTSVQGSESEVLEAVGFSLAAPEGAENVAYGYIEDENNIAQVKFDLNGETFCYRAQVSSITEFASETDENIDAESLEQSLTEALNNGVQLSGMASEWKAVMTSIVKDKDAVIAVNEGDEGLISWLDSENGMLYCLSMSDNATQDILSDTAETVYLEIK